MKKSYFLTVEGPDGCGKTTQSKLLVESLKEAGFKVLHTREPGGTSFAEELRRILLDPKRRISPLAELLLYEAGRAQHTDEVIRPALDRGMIVVSERFGDATVAYQGYGRGMNKDTIRRLNGVAAGGLSPDLTLVLDIDSRTGLARARKIKGNGRGDRLEREGIAFHQRVRKGYFAIARREPRRVKIISGAGSIQDVHERLWGALPGRLKKAGRKR